MLGECGAVGEARERRPWIERASAPRSPRTRARLVSHSQMMRGGGRDAEPEAIPSSSSPSPSPTGALRGSAYRRGALVGRGSYGKVFAATRLTDGASVVIKELPLAGAPPKERQEALNEARLLASLRHPRLVKFHGAFAEDGVLCIVMQRAPGGDLAHALRQAPGGTLPEKRVWRLIAQIAEGLAFLHAKRVLHRDMKPSNVFLDARGDAVIGDLGLSRVLGAQSAFAETGVGTPLYYSPELCEGRPYDERTDVWSLGCLAYELAAGAPPFTAPNAIALARRIVQAPPPPLPQSISAELRFLVGRMLEKDAARRPSAAAVLAMSPVQLALERARRTRAEEKLVIARERIIALEGEQERRRTAAAAAAKAEKAAAAAAGAGSATGAGVGVELVELAAARRQIAALQAALRRSEANRAAERSRAQRGGCAEKKPHRPSSPVPSGLVARPTTGSPAQRCGASAGSAGSVGSGTASVCSAGSAGERMQPATPPASATRHRGGAPATPPPAAATKPAASPVPSVASTDSNGTGHTDSMALLEATQMLRERMEGVLKRSKDSGSSNGSSGRGEDGSANAAPHAPAAREEERLARLRRGFHDRLAQV